MKGVREPLLHFITTISSGKTDKYRWKVHRDLHPIYGTNKTPPCSSILHPILSGPLNTNVNKESPLKISIILDPGDPAARCEQAWDFISPIIGNYNATCMQMRCKESTSSAEVSKFIIERIEPNDVVICDMSDISNPTTMSGLLYALISRKINMRSAPIELPVVVLNTACGDTIINDPSFQMLWELILDKPNIENRSPVSFQSDLLARLKKYTTGE